MFVMKEILANCEEIAVFEGALGGGIEAQILLEVPTVPTQERSSTCMGVSDSLQGKMNPCEGWVTLVPELLKVWFGNNVSIETLPKFLFISDGLQLLLRPAEKCDDYLLYLVLLHSVQVKQLLGTLEPSVLVPVADDGLAHLLTCVQLQLLNVHRVELLEYLLPL